jgi:RND family efflux transporter MFP subunit
MGIRIARHSAAIKSTVWPLITLVSGLLFPHSLFAQQAALIEIDTVRVVRSVQTTDVVGRIVAKRQGQVAIKTDGAILKIPVQVGDRVSNGQLLLELDDALLVANRGLKQNQLEKAQAALRTATAELDLAAQEVQRLSKLQSTLSASKAIFEDAVQQQLIQQALLDEAKIEIKTKKIELAIANTGVSYTRLNAPYNGVVTKRHKEIGDYARKGEPLFSMIGDIDIEVEASVFSDLINGLRVNQTISARGPNGEDFDVLVRAILPQEDDRTRTRIVRFSLPTDAGVVGTPGQGITLKMPSGPINEFLSVHKDAITYQRGGAVAFVVNGDVAELRELQLGITNSNRFEVLAGVVDGENVVTRGNERMRDGQKVRIKQSSQ